MKTNSCLKSCFLYSRNTFDFLACKTSNFFQKQGNSWIRFHSKTLNTHSFLKNHKFKIVVTLFHPSTCCFLKKQKQKTKDSWFSSFQKSPSLSEWSRLGLRWPIWVMLESMIAMVNLLMGDTVLPCKIRRKTCESTITSSQCSQVF